MSLGCVSLSIGSQVPGSKPIGSCQYAPARKPVWRIRIGIWGRIRWAKVNAVASARTNALAARDNDSLLVARNHAGITFGTGFCTIGASLIGKLTIAARMARTTSAYHIQV